MTVYYARPPAVVDVALRGDTAACRASLNRETARLAGRAARLVVDLDAVDQVDSQLLAALVLALKRLERDGGDLVIVSRRADVRRLLGATGLDRVLLLDDD
jgi:anti-anti-sigma factor